MRIEVLVDNEDPQIFSFNKPKLIVGSHESCDIILDSGSVSRKHIVLVAEDDNYFVVDQGSTNGSFINEERLVPGRKTEWTSFFPVRLSGNILLSLLSDEDASTLGFSEPLVSSPKKETPTISQEATRAISLKELQNAKTESLIKKRQASNVQKKVEASSKGRVKPAITKDKKRMGVVQFVCLLILGLGVYFNFFREDPESTTTAPVAQIGATEQVPEVTAPVKKDTRVDVADLTPKTKFPSLITDITCTTDVEKFLCDAYAAQKLPSLGTVQVGTMVNSIFEGQMYYIRAREFYPPLKSVDGAEITEQQIEEYQQGIIYGAFILFMNETFPKELDFGLLKDLNLTIALKFKRMPPRYDESVQVKAPVEGEEVPVVTEFAAGAFVPQDITKLQTGIEPRLFEIAQKYGSESLSFLKEYFRYY